MAIASIAGKFVLNRIRRSTVPLSVCLELTHRCTAHCTYCHAYRDPRKEMTTAQALQAIDELHAGGMERLSVSGGDALLRDDLPEIIGHARRKGIFVTLSTNGMLLVENARNIKGIQSLVISLNGDKADHESTKEGTRHEVVLEAIDWAIGQKIPVLTETAITAKNPTGVNFVLDLAERKGFWAAFHPMIVYGNRDEALTPLVPTTEETIRAIDAIESAKRRGVRVGNSFHYLRYFRQATLAGSPPALGCRPRINFCSVLPDGEVIPCNLAAPTGPYKNGFEVGFVRAFQEIPDFTCSHFCPGPYYEMLCLAALQPRAWLNAAAIVARQQFPRLAARGRSD